MSMGGGKGGGAERISAQPDPALSQFTNEVREESKPVREETFRQALEALQTGGIGARIPIAQRTVEQTRAATSQAMRQTEAGLASAGLGDTPFGQNILAATRLGGETATANVPTDIAQQFINLAPGLSLGSANTIVSGLTGAADIGTRLGIAGAQVGAQRDIADTQATTAILTSMINAMGSIGHGTGFT